MSRTLSVILLNWNGISDTLACLSSIYSQVCTIYDLRVDVVVVDNGSSDNSTAQIHEKYPATVVISNAENLGYAGGNNVGIRHALANGADYLFVLNNDTILAPDCIQMLVTDLDQHPNAAAASPKSYYFDRPDVIYFGGGRIGPTWMMEHVDVGKPDSTHLNPREMSEWLTGCAILFRAETLHQIGLFDSRYFLLFEDADWSLRATRAGYQLRYVPAAHLWHKVSASFGELWSPSYLYYYTRNALLFLESNSPLGKRLHLYCHALRRSLQIAACSTSKQGIMPRPVRLGVSDYILRRFGRRDYEW